MTVPGGSGSTGLAGRTQGGAETGYSSRENRQDGLGQCSPPLSPQSLAPWAPSLPLEGRLQARRETPDSADQALSGVCRGFPLPGMTLILVAGNSSQDPPLLVGSLARFSPSLMRAAPASSTPRLLPGRQTRCPEACGEEGVCSVPHMPPPSQLRVGFPVTCPRLCPSGAQGLLPNDPRTPQGLEPGESGWLCTD